MYETKAFNIDDTTIGVLHPDNQVSLYSTETFYKMYFGVIDYNFIDVCEMINSSDITLPSLDKYTKFCVQKLEYEDILFKRMVSSSFYNITRYRNNTKIDGSEKNRGIGLERGTICLELIDDIIYLYTDCDKIIASSLLRKIIHESHIRSYDFSMFIFMRSMDLVNLFSSSYIEEIDLSNVSLSEFSRFDSLFDGCTNLVNVEFNKEDQCFVLSANRMFYGCNKLKKLDLSMFDFSGVLLNQDMFEGCNFDSLKTRHIIRDYEGKQTIAYIEEEL